MTTTQVVETSVTVNNSPIQDYSHPDDRCSTYLRNQYLFQSKQTSEEQLMTIKVFIVMITRVRIFFQY